MSSETFSRPVTDSHVQALLDARYTQLFQPATAYTAGQNVLNPSGFAVSAKVNFTSGSSYSAGDWNDVVAAAYALKTASNIAIDTDGVPYLSIGANAASVAIDTDGVPYFVAS